MILLSGIAATTRGGTGRMLLGLMEEQRAKGLDARFVFVGNRANVARSLILREPFVAGTQAAIHYWRRASRHWLIRQRRFVESPRLLVIHPQEIGVRWLDRLIVRRAGKGLVTEVFVLDASFFCIRSYNHVDGEHFPCLRCLRAGPREASRLGCRPFPIRDRWASAFTAGVRHHARRGDVFFWTQTQAHLDLLEEHTGGPVKGRVAGLWADDFADLPGEFRKVPAVADIVFHGPWHEAKGAGWALALAAAVPERTFLFPFPQPATVAAPSNAVFRPMTWDTGLAEQVQAAPLTLVPSLWSAPIEGALVKSIAHAPATAVVDAPFGYAAQLPDGLVLRLPADVSEAAGSLRQNWPWAVDRPLRDRWVASFTASNDGLLERLMRSSPT